VSTSDIPKIETPENPGGASLEPWNPSAPASVYPRHGGWLLAGTARTVRVNDTAILVTGTAGCR
jgi:hypothetical protein